MAKLECIHFRSHSWADENNWVKLDSGSISGLPQIFWDNNMPWTEANQWFYERGSSNNVSIKTVEANAAAVHAYAQWLEETGTEWWHFPVRKAERCLVRYRGHLIAQRSAGIIAPSTTQQRMNAVILFYRWLVESELLTVDSPLWKEKSVGVHLSDGFGLKRTITVRTTELSIPNRHAPGMRLEKGLLPVSPNDRDRLLQFSSQYASYELFMLLTLGFFTGMRIGTLTDLKVETLQNAVPDPSTPELYRLSVGPSATPPVATKFGISGCVWITATHLKTLTEYSYSTRRLIREAKSSPENRNNVFLTKFGNRYSRFGGDKSAAINVELHHLRGLAKKHNFRGFENFHFHQTRSTYATELAQIALATTTPDLAVALVKDALLHKDEATSWRYIKFAQLYPVKQDIANSFTRSFLGSLREAKAE